MLIRSFAAAAQVVFAAFAIVGFSAAAQAQFLTFVAANGVDTRPCTVQVQPCRTLQRAVNVTGAGGTIRILSDLLGQNAVIQKSLTVEGGGNSIIGTIVINHAAVVVTLRGLHLTGRGGVANGIRILTAAAVHIEDSTVERYTNDAIKLVTTTATKLFITDTIARTSSDGLYADAPNAQAVIENSAFDNNLSSGAFVRVAKASINGSSASGNAQHGFILLSATTKISETKADNNSGDGFSARAGGHARLNSAEAYGNGGAGLHIQAGAIASIYDCMFIHTGSGLGVWNQGTWLSRGNSSLSSYSGPSPTPVAAY